MENKNMNDLMKSVLDQKCFKMNNNSSFSEISKEEKFASNQKRSFLKTKSVGVKQLKQKNYLVAPLNPLICESDLIEEMESNNDSESLQLENEKNKELI